MLQVPQRRIVPQQAAHAGCHIDAHLEIPVLLCRITIPHNLDISRIADAQTMVVGKRDAGQIPPVKPHELCRHGIDGNLIGRGKNHVFIMGPHRARAGARSCSGAVHGG